MPASFLCRLHPSIVKVKIMNPNSNEARVYDTHVLTCKGGVVRPSILLKLGIPSYVNPRIITEALTHPSAVREHGLAASYQRLEFLGDSVLGMIVTKYIFCRFPTVQEGFLTRLRTRIVSGKTLSGFARDIGLSNMVIMAGNAIEKGWNNNNRILEDVFEALVGALYADLGLQVASDFVLPFVERLNFENLLKENNYKDIVMRFCQQNEKKLPQYYVESQSQGVLGATSTTSPIIVFVVIDGIGKCGRGSGTTKKDAEQMAALDTIEKLGIDERRLKQR